MHQGTTVYSGTVQAALSNAMFKVKLEDEREILCHLGSKVRMHHITILPGDRVQVEMTPYDNTKGRIIFRLK